MRTGLGLRTVASGVAFFVCTGEAAISQAPSQARQDRLNDIAVTLHSGTVVRIRNLAIFRSQNGSALTVYIETPTPSTEPKRLALEAKEIAGLQIKSPALATLTSVSVAVCRTHACLIMREKPEETFSFVRKSDGSLDDNAQPDSFAPDRPFTIGSAADSTTLPGGNALLMRITSIFVGEWHEPVCGSEPPQGESIWFAGGDFCEWLTPTRGRIVAQRDEQHHVHALMVKSKSTTKRTRTRFWILLRSLSDLSG